MSDHSASDRYQNGDLPPVLVVCCGRRLQVCIDNQVECPECGALHWIDHGQTNPPEGGAA